MERIDCDAISFEVQFNTSGWGPVLSAELPDLTEMRYAHFDKKEKITRAADVNPSAQFRGGRFRRDDPSGTNVDFSFARADATEDSSFHLVDMSKTRSRPGANSRRPLNRGGRQGRGGQSGRYSNQGGRGGYFNQGGRGQASGRFGDRRGGRRGGGGSGGRFGGRGRDRRTDRQASVTVETTWDVVAEFDFPTASKLTAPAPKGDSITDLCWCGFLDQYDDSYDRLASRTTHALVKFPNRGFYNATAFEDPIIKDRLLLESAGNVFMTDAILSHIMALPRSSYSWDVRIQKSKGIIFFDKPEPPEGIWNDDEEHDKRNFPFDFLTVSETANEPPTSNEEIERYNWPNALAIEATALNQNFSQQVLRGPETRQNMPEPNPFFDEREQTDGREPASVAYRYRSFRLNDQITIVARCELHAWSNKGGEEHKITVFALNEWDSKYAGGVDWRRKMENQSGAVLATELKNNSFKIAKWTAQSMLAGADRMKLGFVSRRGVADPLHHEVLSVQTFKPKDFAGQIDLRESNMWGIVKAIVEQVQQQEDGEYVLLKDPNKPLVRLYRIGDEEEEDEEEDRPDDDILDEGLEDEEKM